ncbi:enterotoxin [Staphylococcus felis]|uniref:Lantibiotic dehydratase n=3 Tax=Staphylococcus felis TaxID=46127 RepID=A0ABS0QSA6_9STAP|nr:lantibiotic dehydratase [Staphylococcus felis]MBH9582026.1 lantibiotic dehydratase [Staphylococcus felis]REH92517.1 enterotoxin [Staphylococcus felis]
MDNIFRTSEFYMLRTPVLPNKTYKSKLKNTNIDYRKLWESPILRELILTTTYSLYRSINKISFDKDNKKARNAKESLIKYLIRSSTRSTPYGLLSGISYGQFKRDSSQISINSISTHKKHVKIDGKWLCKLVNFLESNYKFYEKKHVIWNQRNYIHNSRLYLDNQSAMTNSNLNEKNISVKFNPIIEYIKELTINEITFCELINLISKKFNINNDIQIKSFIQQLIDKEIIFTDLRPSLYSSSALKDIINKISHIDDLIVTQLKTIYQKIETYASIPIGKGEKAYLEIIQLMSNLFESTDYLQIDTYMNTISNQINLDLANNISEAAYILWLLSPNNLGAKTIRDYHKSFMETYGFEQLVNLKHLLSDINGLGYPNPDNFDLMSNYSFLREKYLFAISNNTEIEITEKDVYLLEQKNSVSKVNAPVSTDIYSEVYFGNYINEYTEYAVISPILSSFNAGATFGRFNQNTKCKIRQKIYAEIENFYNIYMSDNNLKVIQINEVPKSARNLNILNNSNIYDLDLNLDLPDSYIDLNDIYVGATFNKLFLFSQSLQSRIIFMSNSMFNYDFGSRMYKFLREISLENTKFIQPINEKNLESFIFSPRIRYKNIILKPASWKLNINYFSSKELKIWLKEFNDFIEKYKLPTDIILAFGDNRLHLNLKNHNHILIIRKELNKHSRIKILESFLEKSTNNRMLEIVTPLYKKDHIKERNINIPNNKNEDLTLDRQWFSLHLYIKKEYQDDFITKHLHSFIHEMTCKRMINKFFFIKYKEDNDFIKLRVYRDDEDYSKIYNYINEWKDCCLNTTELYDYSIVDYIPEVYRYGGTHILKNVEDYFMYDSLLAINIINSAFKYPKEIIVAISVSFLIKILDIPKTDIEEIITNNVENFYRSHEIRPYKNILAKLTNPENNYAFLKKELPDLHAFLFNSIDMLYVLKNKLNQNLCTSRARIIGSFIHMRCNRIFGVNLNKEKFVLSILNEIEKTKKYWKGYD